MENMKDIIASQRVETRRVAVRSTVWLGHLCGIGLDIRIKSLPGGAPHRPNENKISDGGRERASLRIGVWKSSQ
jgi:hypothetical protein